jgi:alkanesulfonate monooxygenase SsuD/methylene tetrahydromethanopterin reductase-like flavin-dependent oxidoreductase (luciferase family)
MAMDIGIGLPATIPGVEARAVLEWARRADAGPFSSLGVIDRVVYPNFEPLISLAAAAAATERIRLMTTVVLAPLRNAGLLAKQAASLDAISGGRLTLGLGVGGREDDFRAAPAPYEGRGKRFEEQLALMKRIWSGRPLAEDLGSVGPPPARAGGPELLLGGYVPAPIQRVGEWADGFISGGVADPGQARRLYEIAEASWKAEGRSGRPRFVGAVYYGLGADAGERVRSYILDYYGYLGPTAEGMAAAFPASPDAVREKIRGFRDVGMDELVFWPCAADLEQLERLADLAA